ncbi:HAD hydrolase [Entamoeba marina]
MKAVLFDFNGTLLFDSKLHEDAWKQVALEIRNKELSSEEFRDKINGKANSEIVQYLSPKELTKEEITACWERKEEIYKHMLLTSDLKLVNGSIEFFEYLKSKNIPFTIATSSDWNNLSLFIERFELQKWFDIDKIVYNDFTFKGKPAPDIYLKAANVLQVDIHDCLIFEDTVAGIEAGYKAGAHTIIGITSGSSEEYLMNIKGCSSTIQDFEEFKKGILG